MNREPGSSRYGASSRPYAASAGWAAITRTSGSALPHCWGVWRRGCNLLHRSTALVAATLPPGRGAHAPCNTSRPPPPPHQHLPRWPPPRWAPGSSQGQPPASRAQCRAGAAPGCAPPRPHPHPSPADGEGRQWSRCSKLWQVDCRLAVKAEVSGTHTCNTLPSAGRRERHTRSSRNARVAAALVGRLTLNLPVAASCWYTSLSI